MFCTVHFRAVRLGLGSSGEAKQNWGNLLKRSYLLLPMVGIVVLLVMNYTPTFSAFWGGIVTALVLSMLRKGNQTEFGQNRTYYVQFCQNLP